MSNIQDMFRQYKESCSSLQTEIRKSIFDIKQGKNKTLTQQECQELLRLNPLTINYEKDFLSLKKIILLLPKKELVIYLTSKLKLYAEIKHLKVIKGTNVGQDLTALDFKYNNVNDLAVSDIKKALDNFIPQINNLKDSLKSLLTTYSDHSKLTIETFLNICIYDAFKADIMDLENLKLGEIMLLQDTAIKKWTEKTCDQIYLKVYQYSKLSKQEMTGVQVDYNMTQEVDLSRISIGDLMDSATHY